MWRNGSAAWPVANPVVTCRSLSDIGVPSNFVADPFLFIQVLIWHPVHFNYCFFYAIFLFTFLQDRTMR